MVTEENRIVYEKLELGKYPEGTVITCERGHTWTSDERGPGNLFILGSHNEVYCCFCFKEWCDRNLGRVYAEDGPK